MTRPAPRHRLLLRSLRREGWRALVDRLLDLTAERRWHGSFARLPAAPEADGADVRLAGPPVLKLLPTPLSPRFGGVPTQLLHRFGHEEALAGAALLAPAGAHGRRLRLVVGGGGRRVAVDWRGSGASPDDALIAAAVTACRWLDTDVVHLENLAPLPPETALGLVRHGLRPVLSLHDFFAFCRRPHLLEEPEKRFCHYCRDLQRCVRCLRVDVPATAAGQERWRHDAAALAASCEALIFPSAFLRDRLVDLLGQSGAERFHVVPPGVPVPGPLPLRRRPAGRLRLAFVGGAKPVKGSRVLLELLALLHGAGAAGAFRLLLLGGGEPEEIVALSRFPEVEVRGYYRGGRLPHLLRRHGIDLALLLSPVPESYGLTLDECRLAGVPALAFDLGALGERIRAEGGGLLVAPQEGARGLLHVLLPLLADRSALASLPPPPRPRPDAVAEAARRHLEIYRSLGGIRGAARC